MAHITISDTEARIDYSPSSSTTTFAVPFEVFDPSTDLKVIVDGTEITYDATPADATEYSWSGTLLDGGGYEGGSVVLGAGVTGVDVNIILDMAFTRSTDFTYPSATLNIEALNTDLDKMILMVKQLRSSLGRQLQQPDTDTAAIGRLPAKATRASKLLGFDANGDPEATAGVPGPTGPAGADGADGADGSDGADGDFVFASTGTATVAANDQVAIWDASDSNNPKRVTAQSIADLAVAAADQVARDNTILNAFRIAEVGGLSVLDMVDSVVDAFEDETGVDAAASTNEVYDATNDLYNGNVDAGGQTYSNGSFINYGDYFLRWVVGAAVTSGDVHRIRVKVESYDASTALVVENMYAGPHAGSGNAWDFASGQQVALTNGGASNWTTPAGPTEEWTDWAIISVPDATDLIIHMDFNSAFLQRSSLAANHTAYAKAGDDAGTDAPAGMASVGLWPCITAIEIETANNVTLIGNALTADAAPAELRAVLDVEEDEAITINTDLTAELSRDGGTTWTAATLVQEANLGDGRKIYAGTADVSGQPSGTSVKYRVKTLNNKVINIHSVAVQADQPLTS